MHKHTITITTHGGIIQDIRGIPDDVRVEVKPYDIVPTDFDNEEDFINTYET